MSIVEELQRARRSSHMGQAELAERSGLSRMTVQRTESGAIDPRLSTLLVMARALGLELMVVPSALRPMVEDFVRAGGRIVSQEPGVSAPPSIVDVLARGDEAGTQPRAGRSRRARR